MNDKKTSLITQPSDLKVESTFIGLIYGQPGLGKTTLALSAPTPILLDFDKGLKRVQPHLRTPSLQVDTYQQALDLINSDEIDPFETIVVDTLGIVIDRICDYVAKRNPKARQGDGQMTMKGWGEVKGVYIALLQLLKSKGKSLLFVSHEVEEKNGDETVKRLDVAGAARKDIIKHLDFMGYVEMIGNKRTINFSPTDKYFAKNSLELNNYMELPDTKLGNDFISKNIVKLSQDRLVQQADLREKYDILKGMIESNIADLKTVEDVNTYYAEMTKKEVIWDSAFMERRKLADKIAELNIVFDKDAKTFKQGEDNDQNANNA